MAIRGTVSDINWLLNLTFGFLVIRRFNELVEAETRTEADKKLINEYYKSYLINLITQIFTNIIESHSITKPGLGFLFR